MVTKAIKPVLEKSSYGFNKHQTFHFREVWLHKGLTALEKDGKGLAKGMHHSLGVGANMLDAIKYWIQATNLATLNPEIKKAPRPLVLTDLGKLILEEDPYFEDALTLWLIHVELASNKELATLWYLLFNEYGNRDFNKERSSIFIQDVLEVSGHRDQVTDKAIESDFACFLRTYFASGDRGYVSSAEIDCPLSSLSLIRGSSIANSYRFAIGPRKEIPVEVFAYVVYKLQSALSSTSQTLTLENLRYSPLSPGKLLCMDNRAIAERLEDLEDHPLRLARMSRAGGLNSVILNPDISELGIIKNYFQQEVTAGV